MSWGPSCPICGHNRSCCAHPVSRMDSFPDSSHHFDSVMPFPTLSLYSVFIQCLCHNLCLCTFSDICFYMLIMFGSVKSMAEKGKMILRVKIKMWRRGLRRVSFFGRGEPSIGIQRSIGLSDVGVRIICDSVYAVRKNGQSVMHLSVPVVTKSWCGRTDKIEGMLSTWISHQNQQSMPLSKHNRSEMVTVLGPFEALPYYIHTCLCLVQSFRRQQGVYMKIWWERWRNRCLLLHIAVVQSFLSVTMNFTLSEWLARQEL
jgi:hypothetical protein